MKWKFISWESPMAVYYLAKLSGFAPFTLKNGRFYPATLLGKLYPFAVVVATLVLMCIVVLYRLGSLANSSSTVKTTTTIKGSLVFVMNVTTSSLALIIIASRQKKVVNFLNKLCAMNKELKSLGIVEDRSQIFKKLFTTTATAYIIVGIIVGTIMSFERFLMTINPVLLVIKNFMNLNTVLIFTQILLCIKQRFTLVNMKLRELDPTHRNKSLHHLRRFSAFVVTQTPRDENEAERESLTDLQRVQKIGALHMELFELLDQTTHLFAAPILSMTLQYFCFLLVFSYRTFSNIFYSDQLNIKQLIMSMNDSLWSPILRSMMVISQLFVIARVCETTCQEGNATGAVVSKIWYKVIPAKLKDELYMLTFQLLQRPVTVSAFGFFDLGYSYLYNMFCAVSAYLVVMIQLNNSPPNHGI